MSTDPRTDCIATSVSRRVAVLLVGCGLQYAAAAGGQPVGKCINDCQRTQADGNSYAHRHGATRSTATISWKSAYVRLLSCSKPDAVVSVAVIADGMMAFNDTREK